MIGRIANGRFVPVIASAADRLVDWREILVIDTDEPGLVIYVLGGDGRWYPQPLEADRTFGCQFGQTETGSAGRRFEIVVALPPAGASGPVATLPMDALRCRPVAVWRPRA